MSYELQVYALSPLRPSPQDITAKAGESGLVVEWAAAPGTAARPTDTQWSKLLLRAAEAERGGFLVEASPDLERMTAQFRSDAASGDEIPDQVFESKCLYVFELDDESPDGEAHQAAFVIAAWALAGLTDGIVFDPQEEFFADADSFWAIITDESLGEDGEPEGDDPADDDHHEHAGGCCSGPRSIDIDLPSGTDASTPEAASSRDSQRRNRE
jgi:hypothetical protein